MLDLTQISLATEEDRTYQIDRWAALFKATTWEELKMLAKTNQNIHDAITTVLQLTQEEKIRQQCEAREDYIRRTAGREKLLKRTTQERDQAYAVITQKDIEISQKNAEISRKDAALSQKDAENSKLNAENQRLREELELLKNKNNTK